MNRKFSDQKLKEISKSLPQLAKEALQNKDYASCHLFLQQMASAHATLHALGTATLARIWSKWNRDLGEQATINMLDRIGKRVMEPYIKMFGAGFGIETVRDIISLYKHQFGSHIVPQRQDNESLTFNLVPCGSGGNFLLRDYEKKYPQWHTRFSDNTPIYCRGCKSLQRAVNDAVKEDVWTTELNESVTGSCTMKFHFNSNSDKGFFESKDLYALTKTRAQLAIEKAAAGNYDIFDLIENQQHDWKPWHDTLMCWSEYTFAACIEFGGLDYLDECLKECYDSAFEFIYKSMESFADDEERLKALAQNWHYHMGSFTLEEEEDRFVFKLDPCGSGGRIFREEMYKDMFKYDTDLAPILKKPHNITFNRVDFPTYCSHCASGNRDQFLGKPLVFVVDGHAQLIPGDACRQYVWKKDAPRRVEQSLLDQVGLTNLIPVKNIK